MSLAEVKQELAHEQKVLDRYAELEQAGLSLPGRGHVGAVADVYVECAQLYRRVADIYDDWVSQLEKNGIVSDS
ncbi:hypothetical protein [Streptococcus parasanguinis]|uniref:hypothetical protein n=1 Tax=Streptococcus parasanguinis TaxID=1318 RepID=UPI001159C7CD|nr:hypothetical protein [Streptococcus parasanguinis]